VNSTDEAVEAARTAVEQEAEAKKRFEEDTWVEGFAGDFARVAIQAALPLLEAAIKADVVAVINAEVDHSRCAKRACQGVEQLLGGAS
jgi:hypothetical protein